MAHDLSPSDVNKLARVGAAMRLAELAREMASLRKAFPGLRSVAPAAAPLAASAPASKAVPKATKPAAKSAHRGRRKPMDAAERKAVSDRMIRYWAGRRKSKGKKQGA